MNCSTCWFASGGDDRHCGKCACCPESARIAAGHRRRARYLMVKVRDLTSAEKREMEQMIEADQRLREDEERTRYESHQWNPTDDDSECIVCGITWQDCDDECSGVPSW